MSNIIIVWGGGSGISAIAFLLKQLWFDNLIVIDAHQSQITKTLSNQGIKTVIWHWLYRPSEKDFILYSDAAKNSPEVTQRAELSHKDPKIKPPVSFFQFLGIISQFFKTVAISGTHGKSTTTAMTIRWAHKLSNDFALWILGAFTNFGTNQNYLLNLSLKNQLYALFKYITTGKGRYLDTQIIKKYRFVVEADEFDKHFLWLHPYISGITNIEIDHTDTYPTPQHYITAFEDFVRRTEKISYILNPIPQQLLHHSNLKPIKKLHQFKFKYIFWKHNIQNANLASKLIKHISSASVKDIKNVLEKFPGLRRRQEYLGKFENKKIFSDYAHHPTEIYQTLQAFRQNFPNKKIAVIFQPHQGRRILEFWHQFKAPLNLADEIFIYPIYHARENFDTLKKEFKLVQQLSAGSFEELSQKFGQFIGGKYIQADWSPAEILNMIKSSIVVILSAGDIDWKFRQFLSS